MKGSPDAFRPSIKERIMTKKVSSPIDDFLKKVNSHEVMTRNKWQTSLVVHWLSNGVNVITLTVNTGGRFPTNVFTVSRDGDLQESLDYALIYANRMLDAVMDESHRRRENPWMTL